LPDHRLHLRCRLADQGVTFDLGSAGHTQRLKKIVTVENFYLTSINKVHYNKCYYTLWNGIGGICKLKKEEMTSKDDPQTMMTFLWTPFQQDKTKHR